MHSEQLPDPRIRYQFKYFLQQKKIKPEESHDLSKYKMELNQHCSEIRNMVQNE